MSVMLYPYLFCVILSMDLFVLCVACQTGFVNYLVKKFAIVCLMVLCWIDHVWSSIYCVCCACGPSERLDAPYMCFVCVFVCRKLCHYLRV